MTSVLVIALILGFSPLAPAALPNRVVISVDLGRRVATVFKYRGRSNQPVKMSGPILATVPGSIRPGVYRARLPMIGRPAERGASHLDHALLFDGMHSIRSSEHFDQMSTHPIAGSVIMRGDLGGVMYRSVKDAGGVATIQVTP